MTTTIRLLCMVAPLVALAVPAGAQSLQPLGCLIEPHRVVELGSPVIGVIESIKVERGDRVKKGQVIAVLRADVERAAVGVAATKAQVDAEVQAALANNDLAQRKYERAKELVAQKFISSQGLEQTRAEAEVAAQKLAQAREQRRIWDRELKLAEAQLGMRTIRAPANGIIAERYVSPGERVEEKPVVRLATIDPLRVGIDLDSEESLRLWARGFSYAYDGVDQAWEEILATAEEEDRERLSVALTALGVWSDPAELQRIQELTDAELEEDLRSYREFLPVALGLVAGVGRGVYEAKRAGRARWRA